MALAIIFAMEGLSWRRSPTPLGGDAARQRVRRERRERPEPVAAVVVELLADHDLFDGLTINNDHLNDEDHKATVTGDRGVVMVKFQWKPV